MKVRVPMQGTGAEQLVVVMKSRNRNGAKGLYRLFLLVGQPIVESDGLKRNWMRIYISLRVPQGLEKSEPVYDLSQHIIIGRNR